MGNDALYQAGYDAAKKEAEEQLQTQLENLEDRLRRQYRLDEDAFARRERVLKDQLKAADEQITALEDALANLKGFTTAHGMKSMDEQKEALRAEEIAHVEAGHGSRDRQDGIRFEHFMGWPSYQISKHCRVFLGGKDGQGPFEDGKAHGFARSVRDLYEMLMTTGRVGSIVTDPISYRGKVGVFVKGGTARDAAAASQYLDRS